VTGIDFARSTFMTKKRFRRGLAALGVLAAFFLALMALLFAPSLASAEKKMGPGHQYAEGPHGNSGGAPNPIYSEHSWQAPEKVNWNAPPTGPCADGSCATADDNDDTQHFAGGSGSREDSSHSPNEQSGNGGSGGQGNGSDSPRNGYAGGYGGGFPGGTFGGGNPQFAPDFTNDGDTHKCDTDSGKSGKDDSDKGASDKCDSDKDGAGNGDSGKGSSDDPGGPNIQNPDSPDGSHDLPPVDPEHFADPNPETPPTDRNDDLPQQIPEPLTLSLFAVGLAGSVAARRRVKTK
jgi:hypothetical protein